MFLLEFGLVMFELEMWGPPGAMSRGKRAQIRVAPGGGSPRPAEPQVRKRRELADAHSPAVQMALVELRRLQCRAPGVDW